MVALHLLDKTVFLILVIDEDFFVRSGPGAVKPSYIYNGKHFTSTAPFLGWEKPQTSTGHAWLSIYSIYNTVTVYVKVTHLLQ